MPKKRGFMSFISNISLVENYNYLKNENLQSNENKEKLITGFACQVISCLAGAVFAVDIISKISKPITIGVCFGTALKVALVHDLYIVGQNLFEINKRKTVVQDNFSKPLNMAADLVGDFFGISNESIKTAKDGINSLVKQADDALTDLSFGAHKVDDAVFAGVTGSDFNFEKYCKGTWLFLPFLRFVYNITHQNQ